MAFIQTIPVGDADGDVREMYARQQTRFGYVPNYAKVFSHRPGLMKYWADMQNEIRRHTDRRRFELVTFSAAHALKNSACALAHGKALTEYLSAATVRAIAEGEAPRALSNVDNAIVAFARKAAVDASTVTAADVESLQAVGLSDPEIFDIAAIAAARAFFTKLLDALGTEPDSAYVTMDPSLRTALTVGRPIGQSEVEYLPNIAEALAQ